MAWARMSSLPSRLSVWALMAPSMAASLVSSVLLTSPRTEMMEASLVAWSACILSMASVSFLMASSFLRVPWLMASTTLVKSLVTVTSIL